MFGKFVHKILIKRSFVLQHLFFVLIILLFWLASVFCISNYFLYLIFLFFYLLRVLRFLFFIFCVLICNCFRFRKALVFFSHHVIADTIFLIYYWLVVQRLFWLNKIINHTTLFILWFVSNLSTNDTYMFLWLNSGLLIIM